MAFHDFMQDFIDFLLGRGDEEGPAENGLNSLDTAADAIGGGAQERSQEAALQQAPITINLEAPKRGGTGPKSSANQDATLEALALSRTAQTPNTNWRSSGARNRAAEGQSLDTASLRRLLKSRG